MPRIKTNSRLQPRRSSSGSNPTSRLTRARVAVSANSRPASTPRASTRSSERSRSRSHSRTPDSPRSESVTRSPTSGQLTTSPVFSPPSSPEKEETKQEEEDSDNKSDSESTPENIPEGLRSEVLPPSPILSGEENDDESIQESVTYSVSSVEHSDADQAVSDTDFPVDYDEVKETEDTGPAAQAIHPRHSTASHYARLERGETCEQS